MRIAAQYPRPRVTAAAVTMLSPYSSMFCFLKGSSANACSFPQSLQVQSRLFHASSASQQQDGIDSGSLTWCSSRASAAVELLPSYLADARRVERYSPSTPEGALQLSVAENKMLEDLLVPSLNEFSRTTEFPADAIYYQPTHGRESFRRVLATYFKDVLGLSKSLDADGLVVGAGCNAVLENLCISLASPGEGVMIPTPYYAAFEFDLGARAGKQKRKNA
jgi:hypothetical protein